jgi:hypothetical protein
MILLFMSLLVIAICACLRKAGEKGSYSLTYNPELLIPSTTRRKYTSKPRLPKNSKPEMKCKEILESIFRVPFDKIRPDFLKNDKTGRNLEIDCYNDTLKLGLEANGIQHYKYIPYIHKSIKDFEDQKMRDEMKYRKCAENGIKLIVVPYTVKLDSIEEYISSELKRLGILF